MKEFIENFFGEMSPGKFGAAFVMAVLGVFLGLLLSTTKRDPGSKRTPFCFSWSFFFSDNMTRIYQSVITTIIVIFVSLRFAPALFNMEASMFFAFGIGLGIDKVIEVFKRKKDELPKLP